jgi:hypothetical protein
MKIEHIVWEDSYDYTADKIYGLLEIKIYWHGGGSDTLIAQGTYHKEGRFENRLIRIDEDTMGVSGISLVRVGTIVG